MVSLVPTLIGMKRRVKGMGSCVCDGHVRGNKNPSLRSLTHQSMQALAEHYRENPYLWYSYGITGISLALMTVMSTRGLRRAESQLRAIERKVSVASRAKDLSSSTPIPKDTSISATPSTLEQEIREEREILHVQRKER